MVCGVTMELERQTLPWEEQTSKLVRYRYLTMLSLDYHHHVKWKTISEQLHRQSRWISRRKVISIGTPASYTIVDRHRFKLWKPYGNDRCRNKVSLLLSNIFRFIACKLIILVVVCCSKWPQRSVSTTHLPQRLPIRKFLNLSRHRYLLCPGNLVALVAQDQKIHLRSAPVLRSRYRHR